MAIRRAEAGLRLPSVWRAEAPVTGRRAYACIFVGTFPAATAACRPSAGSGDRLGPLSSSVYSVVTKGPRTPVRTEPEKGSKTAVSTRAPAQDPVAVGGLPGRRVRRRRSRESRHNRPLGADRGFGFIRMENGQEVFFHATGMQSYPFDSLQEGQAVTFDIEQDTRGTRAARRAGADRRLGPTAAPRGNGPARGPGPRSLTSSTASST